MRRLRQAALAVGVCLAGVLAVALVLPFLAPDLSYQLRSRAVEAFSGRGGRPYRIALGVRQGSHYQVGTVLNRYLKEKSGYELELVATTGVPQTVSDLLDPTKAIDLATIESSSDAARAEGLFGLASVAQQYFFVIVPASSTAQDFRDLTGPVNPGTRDPGQPPTLGERVLEYYGLVDAAPTSPAEMSAVSIVRPTPNVSSAPDLMAGRLAALTRTQFLHSDLTDPMLDSGQVRLLPIRDHEALARWLPGTSAAFIPAGAYGPRRRVPAEPTPTLSVSTLIVARRDLPGRVARDILDVVYDPRFARDIQQELTEESGRSVGGLPLHPAAEIFYRRHELVTSDRIGRMSFVVSIIAAAFTAGQFISRFKMNERRHARRRLLSSELRKLDAIRDQIDQSDPATARALVAEADDLLSHAEQDAAADRLDAEGIQSLRSLHGICWRALEHRKSSEVTVSSGNRVATGDAAGPWQPS